MRLFKIMVNLGKEMPASAQSGIKRWVQLLGKFKDKMLER